MRILFRTVLWSGVVVGLPACGGDPFPAPVPPQFQLSSPSDGAIGVDGTPAFSWTPSAGAASYTLQLATDAGFASPVVDQPGLMATSFSPGVALSPATVYFWRVLAATPSGTVVADGAPFSFTTLAPIPGDFMLTAPANGMLGVTPTPTFEWTSSLGTASYRLQVSTDPAFGSFTLDLHDGGGRLAGLLQSNLSLQRGHCRGSKSDL